MAISQATEIESFIVTTFSPEQQEEINLALSIFITFSYARPFEQINHILDTSEVEPTDVTQLRMLDQIRESLYDLATLHKVEVLEDTPSRILSQIMLGLYRLTHLEDPVPYLRILESNSKTNEEKLSELLGEVTDLDAVAYMDYIQDVRESLLERLSKLLYSQEENQENAVPPPAELIDQQSRMLARLKAFFEVSGIDNIAYEYSLSGMALGHPFGLYLPIISTEVVVEDEEATAKNILSVFLMSIDTFEDPIVAFRTHSEELLDSVNQTARIEAIMLRIFTELRSYEESVKTANSLAKKPGETE